MKLWLFENTRGGCMHDNIIINTCAVSWASPALRSEAILTSSSEGPGSTRWPSSSSRGAWLRRSLCSSSSWPRRWEVCSSWESISVKGCRVEVKVCRGVGEGGEWWRCVAIIPKKKHCPPLVCEECRCHTLTHSLQVHACPLPLPPPPSPPPPPPPLSLSLPFLPNTL